MISLEALGRKGGWMMEVSTDMNGTLWIGKGFWKGRAGG
jgi:hypothetical protein